MIRDEYGKPVRQYLKIRARDFKPEDYDKRMKAEAKAVNEKLKAEGKDSVPVQGWPPEVPEDIAGLFELAHDVLIKSCGIPNFRNESSILLLVMALRERELREEIAQLREMIAPKAKPENTNTIQFMRKKLKDVHGMKWDVVKCMTKDACEAKLAELTAEG